MAHQDSQDPDRMFDDPEDLVDEDTGEEADPSAEAAPQDAVGDEAPELVIERLEHEMAGLKDRLLRMAADLENTRRRAAKEKTEAAQYGIANFARDLLSVADNFDRAVQTAPGPDTDLTPENVNGFLNGVKMTQKELLTVFERNGVVQISPAGEKFDPNMHQAIAQVPGNGVPKDHVVDVAQPGFMIGDRVLRAAMVTVSTGA